MHKQGVEAKERFDKGLLIITAEELAYIEDIERTAAREATAKELADKEAAAKEAAAKEAETKKPTPPSTAPKPPSTAPKTK
ncbi:hypothetical protein D3C84_986860 [compost metagenome]